MKYQVPQFIEVEDKIFGPFTLKQFLYLAGGGALGYIIWSSIPFKMIATIVALPVVIFFVAMAFYPVNGRPFITIVESAIRYFLNPKRYTYQKVERKPVVPDAQALIQKNPSVPIPKLSDSKLKELTWSLDINENLGDSSRTNQKFEL